MDCKVEFTAKALAQLRVLSKINQLRIKTELDIFEHVEGMAALHLYLMKKLSSVEHASSKYYLMQVGDFIVVLRIVKNTLVVCTIVAADK